jgi:4-aminobutyrate aminotransferase-like enzyme
MHLVNLTVSSRELAFNEYSKAHQKINNLRGVGLGVSADLVEDEKRALEEYKSPAAEAYWIIG